jgi:hypothetical protein
MPRLNSCFQREVSRATSDLHLSIVNVCALKKGGEVMTYQDEILAMQELELESPEAEIGAFSSSTPICTAIITAASAVVAASVGAAWYSSLSFGCGK